MSIAAIGFLLDRRFLFAFFGTEHVILAVFLGAVVELLLLVDIDLGVVFLWLVAAVVVARAVVQIGVEVCYLVLGANVEVACRVVAVDEGAKGVLWLVCGGTLGIQMLTGDIIGKQGLFVIVLVVIVNGSDFLLIILDVDDQIVEGAGELPVLHAFQIAAKLGHSRATFWLEVRRRSHMMLLLLFVQCRLWRFFFDLLLFALFPLLICCCMNLAW